MLESFRIDNLALFQEAELSFHEGLNVISGETGAGKTLFLRALETVLGAKADRDLIGGFAQEIYLEASFDKRLELFAELTDENVVLARRISAKGSKSLVCGRAASADLLREGGDKLVFLTGQHAAQKLSSASYQREILDSYAKIKIDKMKRAYLAWQSTEKELKDFREKLLGLEEKAEFLTHEQEMIAALDLRPGEEEALSQERERLYHAAQLKEEMIAVYGIFSADSGIIDRAGKVKSSIEAMREHDPELADLLLLVENIEEQAREAAHLARQISEGYVSDPAQLAKAEERLSLLLDLRRRYKNLSLEDIIKKGEDMAHEVELLQSGEQRLLDLEKRAKEEKDDYFACALEVSEKRKKASRKLAREVEKHLKDLGLSATLHFVFHKIDPSSFGTEKVEILLKANKNMDPAPLNKGASGGELSRLNLALVLSLPREDAITYVFDEVDAGVGGQTAHLLGDKLADLAKISQVIVVTHLAQIAVMADRHFHIRKDEEGQAVIELVEKKARQKEIARLLGLGEDAKAEEMLRAAKSDN